MTKIDLGEYPGSYNDDTKTFSISECNNGVSLMFDTEYKVLNPKTGISKIFKFSHSTGPEFHSDTKYIYKCDEFILEVCNDPEITKRNAANYLAAKTRKR